MAGAATGIAGSGRQKRCRARHCAHELALLHKDLGQYAAAEPLYLRAVEVKEKFLGKEHPDVAEVLNDLAVLYRREGKYAKQNRCICVRLP